MRLQERKMRPLNIFCGIAVLFTTLAYAHLLHHHISGAGQGDLVFWGLMVPAIAAGILSFVGGILLLKRR